MILQVINVTGQTIRLEVEPEASVLDLKLIVENTEHYKSDTIGLEFAGKLLENDRKLSDYHLQNESTLRLVRTLFVLTVHHNCILQVVFLHEMQSYMKFNSICTISRRSNSYRDRQYPNFTSYLKRKRADFFLSLNHFLLSPPLPESWAKKYIRHDHGECTLFPHLLAVLTLIVLDFSVLHIIYYISA